MDVNVMDFVELHALSNFSFLEGASHPDEMVAQAKALGLPALAITDRNTLAGVVRAHVAAKAAGLRLIVGARLDFVPAQCGRSPRGRAFDQAALAGAAPAGMDLPSLVCLPTDRAAYGRLCRLLSLGQGRADKGACHLELRDVAAHAAGQILIILPPPGWDWRETVRGQGKCGFASAVGQIRDAAAAAGARLYLAAACDYSGSDAARLAALALIADTEHVPLVATNAVRFHVPQRRRLADVLACIRNGTTIADAGFLLAANAERHLKSPAAMARLFKDYPAAIARSMEIAGLARFSLDELVTEYPDEPVPSGATPDGHLAALTWAGAKDAYPDGLPAKVAAMVQRELALIAQLKYAPYFLTVYDIVCFARSRGILCQGRGSAANSAVCYCLGITAVNPTEIDLLFERFMTPERREPPDIDVDFEHERREEVIQYIYARYGRDRAGLAATVISYRARSAVREVGKAMGLSQDTVTALAGMVWGSRSGGAVAETCVRDAGLDPGDPLLAAVLELTDELIGFPRHLSQHVGGFVLTRGPLIEVVPIGNGAMADRTFIEWDKDDLAALGLMKVDILALGMLRAIHRAFDLIADHYGHTLTLATIPREDKAVYDMLCRADSVGVFQVESRAQMNMLPRLKPRTFYDLVIEVAIVRPGPIQGGMVHPYLRRRSGTEPEHYPAPALSHGPPDELRQILGKTKGVPLFQEQAMRIAMVAACFSDAEVNELRKSMATFRKRGTIGLLEEKMIQRMTARGYDQAFAARCFNQIKGFGEYGFPESHAASFALLVYVSAWLKCHYPEVFACALINSQPMGFYAPAQIVRDAREHGVTVDPVDVSHSDWDCTLERGSGRDGAVTRTLPGDGAVPCTGAVPRTGVRRPPGGLPLRLGMRLVDGLGEAEAQRVVLARSKLPLVHNRPAPFLNLPDFMQACGIRRATLDQLSAADAFRSLDLDRRQALWEAQALIQQAPLPLFAWGETQEAGCEPAVALVPMPMSEHVVADYQTLRLSLKAHPMSFLRGLLDTYRGGQVVPASALSRLQDGARVSVAGVVLVRQRPGSAKGVVFMTIEDETGVANAVIWAKTLERFRSVVMGARLIVIHGRIQRHERIIHIVSQRLEDRSDWLGLLADGAQLLKRPLASTDEIGSGVPASSSIRHPGPDASGAGHDAHPRLATRQKPPAPRPTHPRGVRVIPKSRDFH